MFTIEFDHDEIEITIIDDEASYEDLKIHSFDDIVYIRQYDEEIDRMKTIAISPSQWEDLINSMNQTEGAFITK